MDLCNKVTKDQIGDLLRPYAAGLHLSQASYGQLRTYLELLLRWNSRTNLTAIRQPEQIVSRHFGESLFAAGLLFAGAPQSTTSRLVDVGSGAGFPGLPIKIAYPELQMTLIESQNKKATFLRECVRALELSSIEVYPGRAEQWGGSAAVVTIRAVDKFEVALSIASSLAQIQGRLCLLISQNQVLTAQAVMKDRISWDRPRSVPDSDARTVLIGTRTA